VSTTRDLDVDLAALALFVFAQKQVFLRRARDGRRQSGVAKRGKSFRARDDSPKTYFFSFLIPIVDRESNTRGYSILERICWSLTSPWTTCRTR
jgi:hypothetical protein